jgi:hypothetical protein
LINFQGSSSTSHKRKQTQYMEVSDGENNATLETDVMVIKHKRQRGYFRGVREVQKDFTNFEKPITTRSGYKKNE